MKSLLRSSKVSGFEPCVHKISKLIFIVCKSAVWTFSTRHFDHIHFRHRFLNKNKYKNAIGTYTHAHNRHHILSLCGFDWEPTACTQPKSCTNVIAYIQSYYMTYTTTIVSKTNRNISPLNTSQRNAALFSLYIIDVLC